jgi:hypothetical protein
MFGFVSDPYFLARKERIVSLARELWAERRASGALFHVTLLLTKPGRERR